MKRSFIIFLILLAAGALPARPQSFCRNENLRFTPASDVPEKYVYKRYTDEDGDSKELRLAVVRPADNSADRRRPVVIGVHSGGFVDFCPFKACYLKYSEGFLTENFTPLGAVTVSVEYRLIPPLDFRPPRIKDEKIKEANYKAVQDVRDAVKYVFDNADRLNLDTENVFLVGTSAGGITVLHAAYLDGEEAPAELVKKYGRLADREKIKGVISFAGAIYDVSYLGGDGDKIPLMVVHGTDDFLVPIDKGFYFRMEHLTPVYGGRAVYKAAQEKGIPARGLFYDYGHSLPREFYGEVFKSVNDFIRTNINCPPAGGNKTATGLNRK